MRKSILRYLKKNFISLYNILQMSTVCLSFHQVAIAALYYLSDIYLPTSLKVAESSENSESPDENWEYEWDDEFSTTVDDEFS